MRFFYRNFIGQAVFCVSSSVAILMLLCKARERKKKGKQKKRQPPTKSDNCLLKKFFGRKPQCAYSLPRCTNCREVLCYYLLICGFAERGKHCHKYPELRVFEIQFCAVDCCVFLLVVCGILVAYSCRVALSHKAGPSTLRDTE